MSKVQCPHCEQWSFDEEFCDHCGRSILNQRSIDDTNDLYSKTEKWWDSDLRCDTVTLHTSFHVNDYPELTNLVEYPIFFDNTGVENVLYFQKREKGTPLSQFLDQIQSLSLSDVISIVNRLKEIMVALHEAGYIIGAFDLDDFWIYEGDFATILFRVTRPLYRVGEIEKNETGVEFFSAEVQAQQPITYAADVMLVGKLFLYLILQRTRQLIDYNELRYISHQLQMIVPAFPLSLHVWLGKSLHPIPAKRYPTVKEQMQEFYYLLEVNDQRTKIQDDRPNFITFFQYGDTDEGTGKKHESLKKGGNTYINQDRYFFDTDPENEIAIAMVADGISKCKYGSGDIAAQILEDTIRRYWEEQKEFLLNEEEIYSFFEFVIKEANDEIVTQALKFIPLNESESQQGTIISSDFMGSTLVLVFILKNKLFTLSIGDSRIYIHSEQEGLQLLFGDENVMNRLLRDHYSWQEVMETEHKSSLTNHMGMVEVNAKNVSSFYPSYKVKELTLFNNDLVLLCSDGLTDYLNPLGYQHDLWKVDEDIKKLIDSNTDMSRQVNLSKLVSALINAANGNGGGDNITVQGIQIKIDY